MEESERVLSLAGILPSFPLSPLLFLSGCDACKTWLLLQQCSCGGRSRTRNAENGGCLEGQTLQFVQLSLPGWLWLEGSSRREFTTLLLPSRRLAGRPQPQALTIVDIPNYPRLYHLRWPTSRLHHASSSSPARCATSSITTPQPWAATTRTNLGADLPTWRL